jgi:hypothetical protein
MQRQHAARLAHRSMTSVKRSDTASGMRRRCRASAGGFILEPALPLERIA